MHFNKLAPWNWFQKEEEERGLMVPRFGEAIRGQRPVSLLDLHREFDREFDRLFDVVERSFGTRRPLVTTTDITSPMKAQWFKPSLDVISDEKEYDIRVELPGVNPADVNIEMDGNTLKIKGEKRLENQEEGKNFYRHELSYGTFQRILDIPEDADKNHITSSYKDGILEIAVPRKAQPKKETKKIEIECKK